MVSFNFKIVNEKQQENNSDMFKVDDKKIGNRNKANKNSKEVQVLGSNVFDTNRYTKQQWRDITVL